MAKKQFLTLSGVVMLALTGSAAFADPVRAGDLACSPEGVPGVRSIGELPDAKASPVIVPVDVELDSHRDHQRDFRKFAVPANEVVALPADYAMMRLLKASGKTVWVSTQDGKPAPTISVAVPEGSMEQAFDTIASAAGLRWRYDGNTIFLLRQHEWTIMLPTDRDLALAVIDAVKAAPEPVQVVNGVIRFTGDDKTAQAVSNTVAKVYARNHITPFDVTWYKVTPVDGVIDWSKIAQRTTSIRDVEFMGNGASILLDGDGSDVIEEYLSREGTVVNLGTATMVSGTASNIVSRAAGCGALATGVRGIQIADSGRINEDGETTVHYGLTGMEKNDVSGITQFGPDVTLAVASGVPVDGSLYVALVKMRLVDVKGANSSLGDASGRAGHMRPTR